MPTPTFSKTILPQEEKTISGFNAVRLKLASPEKILSWSNGEVTKPDTINYRTQRPERDGLFCEKIFGPIKDWECSCGKYKKIRYKGIICDKCGVEITRSTVRRERLGHINLAAPVSHIWFLRGVPSKIGLVLNKSSQELEKVIYFASFIITHADEALKKTTLKQIEREYGNEKNKIEQELEKEKSGLYSFFQNVKKTENKEEDLKRKISALEISYREKMMELKKVCNQAKKELSILKVGEIISEIDYRNLSLKYGHIFEAGTGAEAVRKLLSQINLEGLVKDLEKEMEGVDLGTQKRIIRRLQLIKNLIKNGVRPEWMILTVISVTPPDLRPMVQIDGSRFASADLNDLYRRVINRNNRLKRLIELTAPEIICRNEKRMLQEAVDALIDNEARRTKTVTASTGQKRPLKSLASILRGKQGRFRQNLLGKRVDYSGRSVIVIGPHLKLHQCGLPKTMAIELFKPFVISQLIKKGHVYNVRSANRLIENKEKVVWDVLESVVRKSYVLLNRAPTLHRLGIQAFQPILIEGKAIQIHPLVCVAFNADFDGDQMAVHVPLTKEAKSEVQEIILSIKNLLKPATGEPIVTPTQDMVWGTYHLTQIKENQKPEKERKIKTFSSIEEVMLAYEMKKVDLNEPIKVKIDNKLVETGAGRVIFNSILPEKVRRYDQTIDKKILREIISQTLGLYGEETTVILLDKIKEVTFEYLTRSGLTLGMDDFFLPKEKKEITRKAEEEVGEVENQYQMGLLADDERYSKIIEIWAGVMNKITELSKKSLDKQGPLFSIIDSGARGSMEQITQIIGLKGLVTNPAGKIIELSIKNSFKEGFDVLEYFISTHGARKVLSDTALRTSSAGYLTRRLIDVAQDVIVTEEDCKDEKGLLVTRKESEEVNETLSGKITGRVVLENIYFPGTKNLIVKKGELINKEKALLIEKMGKEEVRIRTLLTCQTKRGVCRKCYGYDLCYNTLVEKNTAVGIIAAQSIGEPGTQLTLRTFHTGGIAGIDITQGLPRVEELFEAHRLVKRKALISEVDGEVEIDEKSSKIKIKYIATKEERYDLSKKKISQISQKETTELNSISFLLKVKDGQKVKVEDILFEKGKKEIKAQHKGEVKIENNLLKIIYQEPEKKEYSLTRGQFCLVKNGDFVKKGDQLTDGDLDLYELYHLKGNKAVQRYILKEIQFIYSSHGQKVNDKHIELIIRQMFSRIYIKDPGDTEFLLGEIVSKSYFEEVNEQIIKRGSKPAQGKELLLGITKVSLATESFLAAASFQETTRILIEAALRGRIDHLYGLKENVIIGRLIPVGTGVTALKQK